MTTIAYKDGIMVADSRAWVQGGAPLGEKVKIRRLEDGTLVGVSSNVPGGAEQVFAWYEAGCRPDETMPKTFTLLAVAQDGRGYFADDEAMVSGPLEAKYFAIGTGRMYAMGLMEYGCTAEQAVRIATRLDIYSEHPLYWANHGDGPHRI